MYRIGQVVVFDYHSPQSPMTGTAVFAAPIIGGTRSIKVENVQFRSTVPSQVSKAFLWECSSYQCLVTVFALV